MKFLLDQSADFRLIPHLRHLGHDVHVISRNYSPGLPDEDVLAIAREEQRILLVADRDFGELIFHQGAAHAGVIFFRLPGASLRVKTEQLNTVLTDYVAELERGEFLVVTPGQIRSAGAPSTESPCGVPVAKVGLSVASREHGFLKNNPVQMLEKAQRIWRLVPNKQQGRLYSRPWVY